MSDKLTYGGSWLYLGGSSVSFGEDPYNPLHLPPYTIRVRFDQGYTPRMGDSQTCVDPSSNIWDITRQGSWGGLFYQIVPVKEVYGANARGVTSLSSTFWGCDEITYLPLFDTSSVTTMNRMMLGCYHLTSVPAFDTSNVIDMQYMFTTCISLIEPPMMNTSKVTNMSYMFDRCSQLKRVPLYDTSSVTDFSEMFDEAYSLEWIPQFDLSSCISLARTFRLCRQVKGGILDMYNRAVAAGIQYHSETFNECGTLTTTGRAELARIPSDWKTAST